MLKILKTLIALVFITTTCSIVHGQTLQERFESAAEKITGIPYYAFLSYINYDNPPTGAVKDLVGNDRDLVHRVTTIESSLEELEVLMKHPNARVRVLVMLAAYRLESRKAFLLIHQGIGDMEITIPNAEFGYELSNPNLLDTSTENEKITRNFKEVTVSTISQEILVRVGYSSYGTENAEEEKRKFTTWTKRHLFNPHWIKWYDYLRVCAQKGVPINKDKPSLDILKLRGTINQLESPLREWVILHCSYTGLVKKETILPALQSLGPDNLLIYLEKGIRFGLNSPIERPSSWYTRTSILKYSQSLFSSKHAKRLSKLGYYIPAADADPSKAFEYITKGIITTLGANDPWNRGIAAAVLLEHTGDSQKSYITTLLYRNNQKTGKRPSNSITIEPSPFESFSAEVIARAPKEWKNTFIAIANHPKFKNLPPRDIEYLDEAMAHLSDPNIQKIKNRARPDRKVKIIIK